MGRTLRDRFTGCLLGLAVGDALGAPLEFMTRNSFDPADVEHLALALYRISGAEAQELHRQQV